MKERVDQLKDNADWTNLFLGAVIGVIVTSLLAPFISAPIAHLLFFVGVHDAPDVETSIEKTGQFYPSGEPVEEFGGLVWNESYEVYRIEIWNTNERPVDRVKLRWNAPGCIVESNTEGEMIYG